MATPPDTGERTLVATTNDLKNGMVLVLDGELWSVVSFQHVKPGKGGAFVRTTLKHVTSGKVVDRTFNAGTKVDTATVDRRQMTYLYNDGTDYVDGKLSAIGLGVVAKQHFSESNLGFFVQVRAGVARGKVSIDTSEGSGSATSTKPYYGIGAGYDFNRSFGLSLNYDHNQGSGDGLKITANTLSLGLEARF